MDENQKRDHNENKAIADSVLSPTIQFLLSSSSSLLLLLLLSLLLLLLLLLLLKKTKSSKIKI